MDYPPLNKVVDSINRQVYHLFADDTIIYAIGEFLHELIRIMDNELKNHRICLGINILKLNINKCKAMVFGKKE